MERMLWIVLKKGVADIDYCIKEQKRWIKFTAERPVQLPFQLGLEILKSIQGTKIVDHPEAYFGKIAQRVLIQRDGGIGDILLMEPCIRKYKTLGNRDISVLTMNPEILDNHPDVSKTYKAKRKEDVDVVRNVQFDEWMDFRNFSELHPHRTTMHRSDIYALKFNIDTKGLDMEPRLYIRDDEAQTVLKKQPGKYYIGLQFDASHSYRKYDRCLDLIRHILARDEDAVCVIMGSYNMIKPNFNSDRVIDLQGLTTMRDAVLVIRDLDYMIAVDSGLMHIALAFHVPTVCIFSIISPDLRLRYYTGPKRVMVKPIQCIGCGNEHMVVCNYGDKKKNPDFVPPCMNWTPDEIFVRMSEMNPQQFRKYIHLPALGVKDATVQPSDSVSATQSETQSETQSIPEEKVVNINLAGQRLLTMPIITLDEEANLPRFIENVMSHKMIGRVVAIDGGSTDRTVELLEKAGAEVHVHPYIKTYHEQQAMQRNISLSYVPDGMPVLIMDVDEVFSKELSEYLGVLAEQTEHRYGLISRMTFNRFADITDKSKRIKDYPDFQPRYYIWDRRYKFVGGAHHVTVNVPPAWKIERDILHFEKEGKDRDALEMQWKTQMEGVRRYGGKQ